MTLYLTSLYMELTEYGYKQKPKYLGVLHYLWTSVICR